MRACKSELVFVQVLVFISQPDNSSLFYKRIHTRQLPVPLAHNGSINIDATNWLQVLFIKANNHLIV